MEPRDIVEGVIYHNGGNAQRTVVGFDGPFVLYKTPSSKKTIKGIYLSKFAAWAKGIWVFQPAPAKK